MNDRNDKQDRHDHDHGPKQTVGAVFGSREEARQALGALHKAHFRKVWYGVTSIAKDSHGGETMTAETGTGGILPNAGTLVDSLVAHGLTGDAARRIEAEIEPGEAVVTVETEHHDPSEAIAILEEYGGQTELSGTRRTASAGTTRTLAGSSTTPGTGTTSGRRDYAQSVSEDVDLPVWEEETLYVRRS